MQAEAIKPYFRNDRKRLYYNGLGFSVATNVATTVFEALKIQQGVGVRVPEAPYLKKALKQRHYAVSGLFFHSKILEEKQRKINVFRICQKIC